MMRYNEIVIDDDNVICNNEGILEYVTVYHMLT